MLKSIRASLFDAVCEQAAPAAAVWFHQAVEDARRCSRGDLLIAYTSASHFLGRAPLNRQSSLTPEAVAPAPVPIGHWTLEDAGRLVLVLSRADAASDPASFAADAASCYEQGDAREQQSWLRAVAVLPDPGRFVPLAVDACRTNILPLFESIACENVYPARFFPDRNFNQLVLKALFNGIALARIIGLASRANAELARMATDYASERQAAGRSVPADIGLAGAASN
jgi:hypothetical protein